jgi:Fic family protein
MSRLTQRQEKILELLDLQVSLTSSQVLEEFDGLSLKTINRDLNQLLKLNLIEKTGRAKATSYSSSSLYKLTKGFDKEEYFEIELDSRKIKRQFNENIFSMLEKNIDYILGEKEEKKIKSLTEKYRTNREQLSKTLFKKEFERLTIELAWKSSKIEGNTYSLLDTETLLKTGIENTKHSKEEAAMLLNHKLALEFIIANPSYYKNLNLRNILELHALLVDKLGINNQIRKGIVGIVGTNYRPLENEFQVREALEKACSLINSCEEAFTKALYASALLSYIQVFVDGNKRVSRMTCNAMLLANDYCPLSFRSIDISEYKKAILLFYEQNSLKYLKELMFEQYEFAVENYFTR